MGQRNGDENNGQLRKREKIQLKEKGREIGEREREKEKPKETSREIKERGKEETQTEKEKRQT